MGYRGLTGASGVLVVCLSVLCGPETTQGSSQHEPWAGWPLVPRPHHRCPPGARPRSRCILTGRRPVSSTGQITQASGPLLPGEGTPGSEVACRVGDRPSRRRLVSQLSATAVLGRKGRPGHGDPPRPGVCGWMCPAFEISHRALHGVLSSATHSLTPLGDPLQERRKLKSSRLVCHGAS